MDKGQFESLLRPEGAGIFHHLYIVIRGLLFSPHHTIQMAKLLFVFFPGELSERNS